MLLWYLKEVFDVKEAEKTFPIKSLWASSSQDFPGTEKS